MRRASRHEQYDVETGESASRTRDCGTGGTGGTGETSETSETSGTSGTVETVGQVGQVGTKKAAFGKAA